MCRTLEIDPQCRFSILSAGANSDAGAEHLEQSYDRK